VTRAANFGGKISTLDAQGVGRPGSTAPPGLPGAKRLMDKAKWRLSTDIGGLFSSYNNLFE
jgi:hypothetical protein